MEPSQRSTPQNNAENQPKHAKHEPPLNKVDPMENREKIPPTYWPYNKTQR